MNTKIKLPLRAIQDFCQQWQIAELSLFGSVLREDFRAESDVDKLISFSDEAPRYGMFDRFAWSRHCKKLSGGGWI